MKKFFNTIWSDIKQRQNIELYVTLIAIITVFIADVVGIESVSVLFEITLAALAILIYDSLANRHRSELIESKLDNLTSETAVSDIFQEWNNELFKTKVKTAREVNLLAVTNFSFIDQNIGELEEFVKRGGKLKCVLVKTKSNAMEMIVRQNVGADKNLDYMQIASKLSFERLAKLLAIATDPQNVQAKEIDHIPFAVITMIDPNEESGIMLVTLMGFHQPFRSRPSFVLYRRQDNHWFNFYKTSYENLWGAAVCQEVALEKISPQK